MQVNEVREKVGQIKICRSSVTKLDYSIENLKSRITSLKSSRVIYMNQIKKLRSELQESYYKAEKIRR